MALEHALDRAHNACAGLSAQDPAPGGLSRRRCYTKPHCPPQSLLLETL